MKATSTDNADQAGSLGGSPARLIMGGEKTGSGLGTHGRGLRFAWKKMLWHNGRESDEHKRLS